MKRFSHKGVLTEHKGPNTGSTISQDAAYMIVETLTPHGDEPNRPCNNTLEHLICSDDTRASLAEEQAVSIMGWVDPSHQDSMIG